MHALPKCLLVRQNRSQIVIIFHSTTNNNPGKSQSTLIDCCRIRISQSDGTICFRQWPLLDIGYHHRFYMHTIIQPYTWPALVGLHVVFRQGTHSPVALADEHAGGHHPSYISTALSSDVYFQEYLYCERILLVIIFHSTTNNNPGKSRSAPGSTSWFL